LEHLIPAYRAVRTFKFEFKFKHGATTKSVAKKKVCP